jgi:WhiB family redox-sensing transcriptional regulator
MPSNEEWAWREKALCKKYRDIDFYSEEISIVKKSVSICHRCQVAPECLQYAISNREVFGVWGGVSQRNRRALIKKYKNNINIAEARKIVIENGANISTKIN